MPSLKDNLIIWNNPDWSEFEDGESWSKAHGGTDALWQNMISARVQPYLNKSSRCLEIACGHGRITNILKEHYDLLYVVDVSVNCIDFCKNRFTDSKHIIYTVNDGYTLPLPANSVDFVFSWDSLVHCEIDVVSSYIHEIYKVLKSNGAAFLHISNFGEHVGRQNGHMRAETVKADEVADLCRLVGFSMQMVEKVKWGQDFENDAYITLHK